MTLLSRLNRSANDGLVALVLTGAALLTIILVSAAQVAPLTV